MTLRILILQLLLGILLVIPGRAQAQNKPDVVIAPPFTVPSSAVAGSQVFLAATVRNQGSYPAQLSCTGFYLSTNAVWEATDQYLGSVCQNVLPGQSGVCSATIRLPLVAAGTYQVLFVADYLNADQELDETNNVSAYPLTITAGAVALPDLALWRPSLSFTTLPAGGSTGVFSFIFNKGGAAAPTHEIGFYLSTDTVFSVATDVLLGVIPNNGLAGVSNPDGTSGTVAIFTAPVLTLPVTTAPGSYYLVIMADPRNQVLESDETNNSRALRLRVTGPVTSAKASANTGLEVYPNPADYAGCTLRWAQHRIERVEVMNGQGRCVATQQVVAPAGSAVQLDTRSWAAGLYTIRLIDTNGETATRRLVRH